MIRNLENDCPPPSIPKPNKFRIAVLLILTPLVAWYSKQPVNNPWKMRSEYYFENRDGNSALVFFEQNNSKKSDLLWVYLSKNPPIFDTVQLFVSNDKLLKYNSGNKIDSVYIFNKYGWNFDVKSWGVLIDNGEKNIVVSFNDTTAQNSNNPISCDVLVTLANSQKMKNERFFFRPKITIWFANENETSQIPNVYIPKPNEKFEVIKIRDKLSALPME